MTGPSLHIILRVWPITDWLKFGVVQDCGQIGILLGPVVVAVNK